MYCNRCGSDEHYADRCPKLVLPSVVELVEEQQSDYQRVKKWRRRNPDRYREYMREYMRQRRAKG